MGLPGSEVPDLKFVLEIRTIRSIPGPASPKCRALKLRLPRARFCSIPRGSVDCLPVLRSKPACNLWPTNSV